MTIQEFVKKDQAVTLEDFRKYLDYQPNTEYLKEKMKASTGYRNPVIDIICDHNSLNGLTAVELGALEIKEGAWTPTINN